MALLGWRRGFSGAGDTGPVAGQVCAREQTRATQHHQKGRTHVQSALLYCTREENPRRRTFFCAWRNAEAKFCFNVSFRISFRFLEILSYADGW